MVADPLFLRVCTVLWSLPFVAMGVFIAMEWHPDGLWEWLGFLCVELGCLYFAYFMLMALFGSDKRLSESNGLLADGSDLLGIALIAAVVLLALPITMFLRALAGRRR